MSYEKLVIEIMTIAHDSLPWEEEFNRIREVLLRLNKESDDFRAVKNQLTK